MYKKIISLFVLVLSMQLGDISLGQEAIHKVKPISKQDFSDLTMALLHEDYPTAKTLINEGAGIGKDDKHIIGGPFLEWAMSSDESGLIRLLDEMKWIDTSRVFADGTTLLYSAVHYEAHNVLRYLVARKKVNLNRQRIFARDEDDGIGCTALHYAVDFGDQLAAEILIQAGADITIKDEDGYTAADYAINSEMAKLFRVQCNQSNKKTSLQKIEKSLVDRQKKAEMIDDLKRAFYVENSYPFLDESFAAFNKDFKSTMLELIDKQFENNDFDDFASAFDSCIQKADAKLAQELACLLIAQPIDRVMQDYNLKGLISNPIILELALLKNNNQLLLKFLTKPCNNKVIKSLFVDTGLMHSLPVLYHATDVDTLKCLVDHGAGQEESPKNFHAKKLSIDNFAIENNVNIHRLVKSLDNILNEILVVKKMLTFFLTHSVKDEDCQKRRMDAIVLEAKKMNKNSMYLYLNNRKRQEQYTLMQAQYCGIYGVSCIFFAGIMIILTPKDDFENDMMLRSILTIVSPVGLILWTLGLIA